VKCLRVWVARTLREREGNKRPIKGGGNDIGTTEGHIQCFVPKLRGHSQLYDKAESWVSPEKLPADNWALTRAGGEGLNNAVFCRLL
jgi:hypothetical protein